MTSCRARRQGTAALLLALAAFPGAASAATYTWDGGSGDNNWQTAQNWSTDATPPVGSTLNFAGTVRLTPNNDYASGTSFAGIGFDSTAGAFTLTGNPITLTGNITNSSAVTQTFGSTLNIALNANFAVTTTGAGSNVVINGVISGARPLAKGDGSTDQSGTTLTLNGVNTYTGSTSIFGGVISTNNLANGGQSSGIGASSNAASNLVLGVPGSGSPSLAGTLRYTGGTTSTDRLFTIGRSAASATLDASGTGTLTFSNTGALALGTSNSLLNDARNLNLTGSGVGVLNPVLGNLGSFGAVSNINKSGTGTWTLASQNTYTGTTNIAAGRLKLDFAVNALTSNILAPTSLVALSGGTFEIDGNGTTTQTVSNVKFNAGDSAITLSPSAGGTVALTATTFSRVVGGVGLLTLPNQPGTPSFNTGTAITLQGGIVPYLIANGTDLTTFDATNGFAPLASGSYTTLTGAAPAITSAATSNVRVTSGSTGNVTLGSPTTNINSLLVNDTAARTISIGSTQTLNFVNSASKTGTVLIPAGTGAVTLGDTAGVGTINVGATGTNNSELILFVNSTNGLTVNSNITNLGTGATALTKSGIGVTTLNGTNTYLGATRVNAGTLYVNGNQTAATGAVTVSLGATLGGTGTLGGATTVADGGNLTPGTAANTGLLSFASSLALGGPTTATTLRIQGTTRGAAGGYDAINITGALTYAGALTLNLTGVTPGTTYDLFAPGSETGDFSTINLTGNYNGSLTDSGGVWTGTVSGTSFSFIVATGDLTVAAVPEPRVWSFVIVPVAAFAFWRRRQARLSV